MCAPKQTRHTNIIIIGYHLNCPNRWSVNLPFPRNLCQLPWIFFGKLARADRSFRMSHVDVTSSGRKYAKFWRLPPDCERVMVPVNLYYYYSTFYWNRVVFLTLPMWATRSSKLQWSSLVISDSTVTLLDQPPAINRQQTIWSANPSQNPRAPPSYSHSVRAFLWAECLGRSSVILRLKRLYCHSRPSSPVYQQYTSPTSAHPSSPDHLPATTVCSWWLLDSLSLPQIYSWWSFPSTHRLAAQRPRGGGIRDSNPFLILI